jgi:uncharacterized protein YndB with AHSA1/START domain
MASELPENPVRVSTLVKADLAATFKRFTEETDAWWKRGPRYRIAGTNHGSIHLEPRLNGRLFESYDTDGVTRVVRMGRVRVWEPSTRIVLEWRAPRCAPSEVSEVEVTFTPDANADVTRVTLTHRGWNALPADHPARRELDPIRAFWIELLASLAAL